jgi:hypothetical protein
MRCGAEECDILSPIEGATGYRAREASARCEGLFAARIAGGGIELVSLTRGPVVWDSAKDRVLFIEPAGWTPAAGTRLRGVGVPAGLYYRLDATLAPGSVFRIPLDAVLLPEHIGPEDFGIYAFRILPGQISQHLPVHVKADVSPQSGSNDVVVTIRPAVSVSNVRVRLVTEGGTAPPYGSVRGAAGLVPAGSRVDISLGEKLPVGEALLYVVYNDPRSGLDRVERFDLADR